MAGVPGLPFSKEAGVVSAAFGCGFACVSFSLCTTRDHLAELFDEPRPDVDVALVTETHWKLEAETLRKRAHFWQKLASLLSSIPRRHLLLMPSTQLPLTFRILLHRYRPTLPVLLKDCGRTKLQIRDQQGLILGPKEEIKEIETFFTHLYATGQRLQMRLPQPAAAALGSDLLVSALKSLRPKKASLPTAAPAALWKMAAEPLAEYVVQRLHTQNTADWPDLWHIAWLCLLPKKPASHRPDQLRPISLLHPLAKSIAWGLNKLVLDAAMASLLEDPQFAYLPTRGVDSAMDTFRTPPRSGSVNMNVKLQVYVWSTLRYALLSSGLPAGGLEQLTGLVAKQIRLVTRQPAHIVHNTNQELFAQHHIMPPGEWLIAAQERRLEQARVPTSCPENLRSGLRAWREQVLADLRQQQSLLDHKQQARLERHTRPQTSTGVSEQAGLVELPSTITGLACDVCGTYFPSYTSMMSHRRTKHRTAEPLPRQNNVNVYEHALDGMPQCKHCLATFSGLRQWSRNQLRPNRSKPLVMQPVRCLPSQPSMGLRMWLLLFFNEPDILQAASVGFMAKSGYHAHSAIRSSISPLGMPRGALSCLGLSFLCTFTSKADMAMADLQEDSVTQQVGFFQHLLPSANPTLLSQIGVKGNEPQEGAPNKHRRLDKGGKGQGNGRPTRGQKRQGNPAPHQGLAPRGPQLDMRHILSLVLRMLLRQEDELQMLRLDKAFCLFVDPVQGDGCILKALFKIAKAWKDKRDQDPPQVNAPLRLIMLEALLTEMKNRLKLLSENAEAQEMAIKNQWAIRQGESLYWQFQSWDPAAAKVIIHPKREPILMDKVVESIDEALILCRSEGLLHRFHATRPLSEEPKSPQAVFLLQVSLRGEAADNFHGILMTLSECAVWRVMNVRLRPERLQRSQLAKQIESSLQSLCSACNCQTLVTSAT
ncbi:hypothetical protein AK812_SmicGene22810 [Symbiodinium microadriaticum]|uniref:C2H2-type domain-containing protein n=1 Tax=Symbiodinium microadriaticum TaxID=2951 RepID=A0A1Q9DIW6_SYMMI|nr:hypothetical protein AK812_SmicGene22810 [Symbiodinium microadriaticum]